MITNTLSLSPARVKDYLELAKIRLVSLSLLSTMVGFFLASRGPLDWLLFFNVTLGAGLVAAGSMSLNQWMESNEDARMRRTMTRPIPASRLFPFEAFLFGTAISIFGFLVLYFTVNLISTFLAALTWGSYLLAYTPLKKKTSLCTIVGAVPGALPPLIGWAAVASPTYEAWILFAIIFLWQMPHFLAIAWFCRKDYEAAGFKMISVENPDGLQVGRQIAIYSFALLPVSLLPSVVGMTGHLYFVVMFLLGSVLVLLSLSCLKKLDQRARQMFRASILYLAVLLLMMVVDKA